MNKTYHVYEMNEALGGFGIVASDYKEMKGWKSKPVFSGIFTDCLKEKTKQMNIAKNKVALN